LDPALDDDDAQRTLERHALANAHSLARRLGYADAIDRYGDRFFLICVGIIVFFVVTAVAISMMSSRPDPRAIERQRCELDAAVHVVDEKRAREKASYPKLTQRDLENLVTVTDTDVEAEAARRCMDAAAPASPR